VLNIGKLLRGKERYYLDQVARSQEEYYIGAGEAPGHWAGTAAADLDVAGEVSEDGFLRMLAGAHPDTAARLVGPPRGQRVLAFDLTFRAPKSVSILWALDGAAASRTVHESHEHALSAALGYLERHAAIARRGAGGQQLVRGNGFLAAVFRHRTSRAGDPLLHSHALVANLTRGPDGRWTALDGRALYAHAKTAGYLYQAVLRHELTEQLGVTWERVHNGVAELSGIPPPVLEAFSKRRQQIKQRMRERGEHSAKSAQTAALDTRSAKERGVSQETLLGRWRRQAEALGFTVRDLEAPLGRATSQSAAALHQDQLLDDLAAPEGLTRQASTFSRRDVLQAICERLPTGAELNEIERLADRFLCADERVVPVTYTSDDPALTGDTIRRADGRAIAARADTQRYSTSELVALETSTIAAAQRRLGEGAGVIPEPVVDSVLANHVGRTTSRSGVSSPPRLGPDQQAMVRTLTTSGHGVQVVNAHAGTGKTFALDAARAIWQAAGYRVLGAALAAQAAKELADGAGIESSTIARLLLDLEDPRAPGLGSDTVLVIDEASMVGTRQLARLLDHAKRAGINAVLVGDTAQLPEIDCGGLFRGLLVRLGGIKLDHNRRQTEQWEREALELLRAGDPGAAIGRYWQHGRVVVGDSAPALRRQLVADWWAAMDHSGERPPVMIAARRADVADLNGRARVLMAIDGRLGTETLIVGEQEFAVGDRIVTLHNQRRRLGCLNGTRGTVIGIDQEAGALEVHADDGRTLRLPRWYLTSSKRPRRRVDYGYAITGHKVEGMTTDRAFILGSDEIYKEWGYTALSRGTLENRLYLVVGDNSFADELDALAVPKQDPLAVIVRALGRSRAKRLAIDHLPTAHAQAATLPDAALRDRIDNAATLLEQRPRLTTQTTPAELRHEQAVLRDYRRDELSWLAHTRERLASPSLRARERRRLRSAARHREAAVAQLDRRLEDLDRRLAELDREQAAQSAWDHNHAEPLAEALIYGGELSHRELAAIVQLENDPPAYLVAVLGGRPNSPEGRDAWRAGATAIEAYRASHNVSDPDSALGPSSTEPDIDLERAPTTRLVDAAVRIMEEVEGLGLTEATRGSVRDVAL
jgi:conjugative relaxase-like TrwC/TraI family protein